MAHTSNAEQKAWRDFQSAESLTDEQQKQFQTYAHLLAEWNKRINLTAINTIPDIITRHFRDSLSIRPFLPGKPLAVADVGTGAGFPGIPIKIIRPDVTLILIEVNNKKIAFLQKVVNILRLENVHIFTQDWRTFVRSTDYSIDFFFARASLAPQELVRIFRSDGPYARATLVYFASQHWKPDEASAVWMRGEEKYVIAGTPRRLIFFSGDRAA